MIVLGCDYVVADAYISLYTKLRIFCLVLNILQSFVALFLIFMKLIFKNQLFLNTHHTGLKNAFMSCFCSLAFRHNIYSPRDKAPLRPARVFTAPAQP